jgi:hypothetical protein
MTVSQKISKTAKIILLTLCIKMGFLVSTAVPTEDAQRL